MNANELADILLKVCRPNPYVTLSATMLRQQQAEIEALKKEAALQRLSDFTQEADNEPLAWINKDDYHGWLNWDKNTNMPINIPLYTHPAKTLTEVESYLSNNSIKESVINCCGEDAYESIDDVWWRLLANDLLRKAQEK